MLLYPHLCYGGDSKFEINVFKNGKIIALEKVLTRHFSLKRSIYFNVHGFVHRNNILIYIQRDPTSHSLFYLETAPNNNNK
jgi:hypothetical protein